MHFRLRTDCTFYIHRNFMKTILEAFQEQLFVSKPMDGNWLRERTFEEAAAEVLAANHEYTENDARQHCKRFMEEYAEHVGEKKLIYLTVKDNGQAEVLSIWESLLPTLEADWVVDESREWLTFTPALKRKK